uniref:Disease resistance N-terminal domain-containing protein n=1 Tax=Oryza nivara TaxID=4536 RepID=A0A0E0GN41_ORYNI
MGGWELGLESTISIATLVLTEVHRMRDKKKKKVPADDDTLEEDVAFIKKDFQLMESFLADAAEKRRQTATTTSRPSRSLSTWLRHLRGLSQDVEDCLQEFCLHLERPPRAKSKLLLPLDTITKQIRRLRNEIEHVNKSSAIYCNAVNFGPDAAQPMFPYRKSYFVGVRTPLPHAERERWRTIWTWKENNACDLCSNRRLGW